MPKHFTFISPEHSFKGELESMQCQGVCKNGQQCKRRVTIAQPYCWNHLQSQMHLKVGPSTIKDAGKGLFAIDRQAEEQDIPVFMPNQLITEYRGQNINDAELFQRYKKYTAPYTVKKKTNSNEDAALKRGVGSLANRPDKNHKPNAEFAYNSRPNVMNIKANRRIYNGEEIFVPYGTGGYKMHENGVRYFTK